MLNSKILLMNADPPYLAILTTDIEGTLSSSLGSWPIRENSTTRFICQPGIEYQATAHAFGAWSPPHCTGEARVTFQDAKTIKFIFDGPGKVYAEFIMN